MCKRCMTNEAVPDDSLCCLPTRCFVVFAVPPDCCWRAVFSPGFWLELEIQWQRRFLPIRDFLPLFFQKCAERKICFLVCLSCFQFVFSPFFSGDSSTGLGKFCFLKDVRWLLGQCTVEMSGTDVKKMGQQQSWCMATVLGDEIRFSSLPPFHGQKWLSSTRQKTFGQTREV